MTKRHRNSKHCARIRHMAHTGHSGSSACGNLPVSSACTTQPRGTVHKRDSPRCDANCLLNKQSAVRADGEVLGEMRAPGRPLGTTLARASQARNTELGIASMDKTVRSTSKNVVGIRVAPGTGSWQKPRGVRRYVDWMASAFLSVSTSAKPSLTAFVTRSAASWWLHDGATPRCWCSRRGGARFAESSAAHTDPSLVAVALC